MVSRVSQFSSPRRRLSSSSSCCQIVRHFHGVLVLVILFPFTMKHAINAAGTRPAAKVPSTTTTTTVPANVPLNINQQQAEGNDMQGIVSTSGHTLPCTDTEAEEMDCLMDGECFVVDLGSMGRAPACRCPSGWVGERCEFKHVQDVWLLEASAFLPVIILAVLVVLLAIVALIVGCYFKRKKQQNATEAANANEIVNGRRPSKEVPVELRTFSIHITDAETNRVTSIDDIDNQRISMEEEKPDAIRRSFLDQKMRQSYIDPRLARKASLETLNDTVISSEELKPMVTDRNSNHWNG